MGVKKTHTPYTQKWAADDWLYLPASHRRKQFTECVASQLFHLSITSLSFSFLFCSGLCHPPFISCCSPEQNQQLPRVPATLKFALTLSKPALCVLGGNATDRLLLCCFVLWENVSRLSSTHPNEHLAWLKILLCCRRKKQWSSCLSENEQHDQANLWSTLKLVHHSV